MTSILFLGDPHFKLNNLPEVELYIERTLNLVKERTPTVVVIGGDLLHYHERLHTECLNVAHRFVDALSKVVKTYVLVGNHDMVNNQQFLNNKHWMNGMKSWDNVEVIDRVVQVSIGDLKFVMCPYVFPGRLEEALNTVGDGWRVANTIFCHQEFRGCKMGAIVSEEGDLWASDLPLVVAGHIHTRQWLAPNIYYAGSSMQHAFGESEKNTLALIHYHSGTYRVEEVDLGLPRKRIINLNVKELDDYKMEAENTLDKVRLTVTGTYEEFKTFRKSAKYKKLIKGGVKVVYRHRKAEMEVDMETAIGDKAEFQVILANLVKEENDEMLTSLYKDLCVQ